jgi:phosphoribosylformimino-5-aminoimidazole carboxamide ribotide isomerase
MTVIPAIDLRGGRCVRLRQGDFAQETVYGDDPLALAHGYADSGFTRLHVVDLDGARSGEQRHQAIVSRIVEATGLMVQLGGGIRHRDALAAWLDAGVARCVVGSMAASDPDTVADWFGAYGTDSLVLALDVRTGDGHEPLLSIHGWTRDAGVTLWQALERFRPLGLRHVLCTDVARDGTMNGPNVELYEALATRCPELEVQASGGVRGVADLADLRAAGCAAAITGRALLDAAVTPAEVMSFLRGA